MKKILKGFLGLCLCLPLISGCSNEKDASDLVMESMKVMEKVESASGDFEAKIKMSVVGDDDNQMSMDMSLNSNYEMIQKPMAMHLDMKMDMSTFGQKQKQEMEMYLVNEGDKVKTYMNTGINGWLASTTDANTIPNYSDSNKIKGLDKKLVKALEPKLVKSEKVNGYDTDKVRFSFNKKSIKSLFESLSKIDEFKDTLKMPKEVEDELDKIDEKINLDFFMNIDKKSKRMVKYELSISDEAKTAIEELLNSELGKQVKGTKMNIDTLSFTFNMKEFDKVKEIVVPQEVIDSAVSQDAPIEDPATNEVENEDTGTEVAGNIATQTHLWESMKFNLDGKDFVLNKFKAQEVADLGYKLDEGKLSDKFKKDDFKMLFMSKGESSISLSLTSSGKKAIKVKDGIVSSISTHGNSGLTIEGKIKVGSTKEEVIAAYGEPNTTYINEGYEGMEYSTENFSKSLTVSLSDGVVDSISLGTY